MRESHGEFRWSVVFALHNRSEKIHLRHAIAIKRGAPSNHLVYQNAKTPVICRRVVPSVQNHFRREIQGSTTQGVRLVLDKLGKTKVNNHGKAISPNQHVLGLAKPSRQVSRMHVRLRNTNPPQDSPLNRGTQNHVDA